jgi:hypothetical protein
MGGHNAGPYQEDSMNSNKSCDFCGASDTLSRRLRFSVKNERPALHKVCADCARAAGISIPVIQRAMGVNRRLFSILSAALSDSLHLRSAEDILDDFRFVLEDHIDTLREKADQEGVTGKMEVAMDKRLEEMEKVMERLEA